GVTHDLFGSVSEENVARIKRQNARKISVIIGNPPYNANQANENDNNKNREYPTIDARIKQTYIHESTAQKTKLYDMYARFFRWASDRLAADGVLTFVTNRSFIDSRTFDGFRKVVAQEFAEVYVVDLGGDVRANPKLSGTKHNVFGIQTGVAISFLVKRHGAAGKKGARVFYARRPEMETAEEKLAWLGSARAAELAFEEVRPDAKGNWLNLTSNDFDELMPIASKDVKASKTASRDRAIFKLFSLGVVTNRDDWVYSDDDKSLISKVSRLVETYNADLQRLAKFRGSDQLEDMLDAGMKWTRAVKSDLRRGTVYELDLNAVTTSYYRPFVKRRLYFSRQLNEMVYQVPQLFGPEAGPNQAFCFAAEDRSKFGVIAFDVVPNKDIFMPSAAQVLALYRYEDGNRIDNITDWSLAQFKKHYQLGNGKKAQPITKEVIFHYVYAVLHDPVYREKYAQNLKREFPRIPFYADFWQWAGWGKALMDLHIGYESVEPWPLTRIDVPDDKARAAGQSPKAMLKADKDAGLIRLDSETTLAGVPAEAWDYRLGNRSALEWILDQYKEKTPKDPTIRQKFNTYRFADHKEQVIDLLQRVTRVSVETMDIVARMKGAAR
ncbi:MAG: type ISP restriction/modification enzyme, partial [Porticoccaceae bacterium]